MNDAVLAKHGIDPHPFARRATLLTVVGAVAAVGGTWLVATGTVAGGLAIAFGLGFVYLGVETRRSTAVVPAVNRALQETRAGRIDNATELLDYVSNHSSNPYVLRAVDHQRAQMACRRSDFDETVTHTTTLLARKFGVLHRFHGEAQTPPALGLRALALASLGRHDEAQRDVEGVRAHGTTTADALAYAELAEAVSLERRGERDALREHLSRQQELLNEYTQPRERELVRALERMLLAQKQSVYRKPAKTEEGQGSIADWVAAIAPDAADFAQPNRNDPLPAAPTTGHNEAAKKSASANVATLTKGKHGPGILKVVLLWVALVLLFLVVWMLLEPGRPGETPLLDENARDNLALGVPMFLSLGLLAFFAAVIAKARSYPRRLIQASAKLARGPRDEALAELESLASCQQALTAAGARDLLAKWAARQGQIDEALVHVDGGLARLNTDQFRALASDQLLPSLLGMRAWCLAALDRNDEAETALDTLRTSFRAYHDLDAAILRVRAIQAARVDDVATLASLSNARAELALSPRDELVLDLGRAAVSPGSAGAGEVARLRTLVRSDGELIQWANRLAPGVVLAFQASIRPEAEAAQA
jgi:hypothetical protein